MLITPDLHEKEKRKSCESSLDVTMCIENNSLIINNQSCEKIQSIVNVNLHSKLQSCM